MAVSETASTTTETPRDDIRQAVSSYTGFHDESTGGDVEARKEGYQEMVVGFYDLVTDFYERGWGKSFHFAPRYKGEPFDSSIKRHQHYVASRLGLGPGMRVLDVGCGVGGPMREIARFSGASVTGVNNNAYQVDKARRYNTESRLDGQCELIEADFMHVPRDDVSFDAIYAFEATCHAPDKTALFRELFRLLKPGGKMAIYEWCLTESYDPSNSRHREIKKGIEQGNGLPDIWTVAETRRCFADAGFVLLDERDKALDGDPELPWHHALAGREPLSPMSLQRTAGGRVATGLLIRALERLKIAPKGTMDVSNFLHAGGDALVAAGDAGCFTPMEFFLAEKPGS